MIQHNTSVNALLTEQKYASLSTPLRTIIYHFEHICKLVVKSAKNAKYLIRLIASMLIGSAFQQVI